MCCVKLCLIVTVPVEWPVRAAASDSSSRPHGFHADSEVAGSAAGPGSSKTRCFVAHSVCQLLVTTLSGRTVTLDVDVDSDTVCTLKQRIQEKEGVPVGQQLLMCAGRQLVDGRAPCMAELVRRGATIHLHLRLPGGSLALDDIRGATGHETQSGKTAPVMDHGNGTYARSS